MRFILASLALAAASLGVIPGASAQSEVSIAVAGPMTGEYASFGAQFKAGAEAAVADINKAGGVLGKQLKLEVGDDACDPEAGALSRRAARGKERADGGGPLLLRLVDTRIRRL